MKINMFLYKEYNDELAYGEEYTKLCPTKDEAQELLRVHVCKGYGVKSLDELRADPEFANDIIEDDHVSIANDGDDVSYFVVEEHEVTLSEAQLDAAYREGNRLHLESEIQESLAKKILTPEERTEIAHEAAGVFEDVVLGYPEYAVVRKGAIKLAVDRAKEHLDKEWEERDSLYKGRLRAFHHVDLDGIRYVLLEDYTGQTEIRAVRSDRKREYDLRIAWIRNNVGDPAKHRLAIASMTTLLPARRMIPSDMIRFITSRYNDLFYVPNFGTVLVDGKPRQVYYIDDCHFGFVGGSVFHICEYAEMRERRGIQIALQPVR